MGRKSKNLPRSVSIWVENQEIYSCSRRQNFTRTGRSQKAVTMNLVSPRFLTNTLILGLISLTVLPQIYGQQRSREEILKEAGRLVTEAERKKGDAYKKVQAGADRKIL